MYRKPIRNSWFFCALDFSFHYDNLEVPTTGFIMNNLRAIYNPLTEQELIECLNAIDSYVFDEDNPFELYAGSSLTDDSSNENDDWEDNPFK